MSKIATDAEECGCMALSLSLSPFSRCFAPCWVLFPGRMLANSRQHQSTAAGDIVCCASRCCCCWHCNAVTDCQVRTSIAQRCVCVCARGTWLHLCMSTRGSQSQERESLFFRNNGRKKVLIAIKDLLFTKINFDARESLVSLATPQLFHHLPYSFED